MAFTIQFTQRDLATPAPAPELNLTVERLEWRAVGGPWQARLRASGASVERLWQLAERLRCGVRVTDERGPAWWGYIGAVEIHAGRHLARVDLAGMWNRIRVGYQDDSPGQTGGAEHYTDWIGDAESIRTWGTKEINLHLGPAARADADAYAAGCLAKWKAPAVTLDVEPGAAGASVPAYAILEGRGWWETLNWQYYFQERGQVGNLHGGSSWSFGTNASQRLYQTFLSPEGTWDASEIWLKIKRVGVPADGVTVELATQDTGGTLATATAAAEALEDELDWVKFTLSAPVSVSPTPVTVLRVLRSGSLDDANYYALSADQGQNYTPGTGNYFNGTNWLAKVPPADLAFLVVGVEDTGLQLKAAVESGQFITGCRAVESGIDGRLYRDGTQRAGEEAERLLRMGADGLARVDPSRQVEISAAPPAGAGSPFRLGAGGVLERADGRPACCSDQPVGQWAQLAALGEAGQMAGYASEVFLERVIWEGSRFVFSGA